MSLAKRARCSAVAALFVVTTHHVARNKGEINAVDGAELFEALEVGFFVRGVSRPDVWL